MLKNIGLFIYRRFWRFVFFWKELPRNTKWGIQRLFRGHSDCDVWGLYSHLNDILAKKLRAFRKLKMHGHPCSFKSVKAWEKAIDKMIWSFENYEKTDKYFKVVGEWKMGKPDKDGNTQLLSTGMKMDEKGLDKHYKKVEEGLDLFREHYGSLWD